MQHCSGVVAAVVGTADMAEGIVEEGMVDEENFGVEIVEEIIYGKTDFLDGSSSTEETNNFVGLVAVSKGSKS